jgi:hypothetical protein
MPKRERTASEGYSYRLPPAYPLTIANLDCLQDILSPATMAARLSSPNRSTASATTIDERKLLKRFRISVETRRKLSVPLLVQSRESSLLHAEVHCSLYAQLVLDWLDIQIKLPFRYLGRTYANTAEAV